MPLHSDQGVSDCGVSLSWWRLMLLIFSTSWSRWESCCWHYWIQMLWLMGALITFFCIFPFPCPWDAIVSLTADQGFVFSRKCNCVVFLKVIFRGLLPSPSLGSKCVWESEMSPVLFGGIQRRAKHLGLWYYWLHIHFFSRLHLWL